MQISAPSLSETSSILLALHFKQYFYDFQKMLQWFLKYLELKSHDVPCKHFHDITCMPIYAAWFQMSSIVDGIYDKQWLLIKFGLQ